MSNVKCKSNIERKHNDIDKSYRFTDCDWNLKISHGVATTLVAFEIKRLLVILFELFIQWTVIQIVGGFQPVVLSILDIFLGFFSALGVVYTLHNLKTQEWSSITKQLLKCLPIFLIVCVIMNVFTLLSIGYNVSIREQTIASVFNNSMQYYSTDEYEKSNIDQIQFNLECCGHTNYYDWFCVNWQDEKNSREYDENIDIKDYSVPFSCCRIKNHGICIHTEITKKDISTINNRGCSSILSYIILKIVIVAYTMGIILIITQIFLAILIIRMLIKSSSTEMLRCAIETSQNSFLLSECGKVENYCPSSKIQRLRRKRSKIIQVCLKRPRHCQSETRHHSRESSLDVSSESRIKSSFHLEHCVPQKRSTVKSKKPVDDLK